MSTSQCVAFSTPGLIPLEAFTTFGVNAKPNSTNPFGYFGTGLKYAIAVCLRNGCTVVLWRGTEKYTFYVRQADFRGKDFGFVRMKKEKWLPDFLAWAGPKYEQLPFTTELGKNWELWQAFRELETNTRDEGGVTQLEYWNKESTHAHTNRTTILVFGSKFIDEFHDMGRHFLEGGATVREDEAIQVIDRSSQHIYYRGVRIMDLKVEAEFTYNFLCSVDLTEDRTAKNPWMIESMIARHWVESKEPKKVRRAVQAPRGRYESRISYAYISATPSRSFSCFAEQSTNPTAREYWNQRQPTVATDTTLMLTIPKPSLTPNEIQDIVRAVCVTLDIADVKIKDPISGSSYDTTVDDPVF